MSSYSNSSYASDFDDDTPTNDLSREDALKIIFSHLHATLEDRPSLTDPNEMCDLLINRVESLRDMLTGPPPDHKCFWRFCDVVVPGSDDWAFCSMAHHDLWWEENND